jgi:hypothetical protein
MSRWARRVDTTHVPIRNALVAAGASIWDTSRLGGGWPDMVAGWAGRNIFIEAKWRRPTRGAMRGGSHGETDNQRERREAWRGDKWLVVDDPESAVLQVREIITGAGL